MEFRRISVLLIKIFLTCSTEGEKGRERKREREREKKRKRERTKTVRNFPAYFVILFHRNGENASA